MSRYAQLVAGILMACSAFGSRADTPCSYCGTWRPFSSLGAKYTASDLLTVSTNAVSLPGCSAARTGVVEEAIDSDVISDRAFPKPIRAIVRFQEAPKCSHPVKLAVTGALLMLRVDPKFQQDSEELDAEFVMKDAQSRTGYKSAGVAWYLVRSTYNPCDEGSGRGSLICGMIAQRRADDRLNAEWRLLLNAAGERRRQSLVRTQRAWLKVVAKACSERGKDSGGAPEWIEAHEVLCTADAYDKRAGQFVDLRACYEQQTHDCPELSVHP